MTDDERLGALFRDAASDSAAPAPGFDHEAVVRASRRITARRRAAVTVGGLALFAAVGIGGTIVLPEATGGGGDAATVAAPMLAPEGPSDSRAQQQAPPPAAAEGAPGAGAVPDRREVAPAPAPGAAAVGGQPPLGPGTTECADRQDPALRAVVEEFLPEVVGAPRAAISEECRPRGERGVNLEVRDGATAGLLTVQYLPPGTAPSPAAGGVSAPTASGGTVVVITRGAGPGAPAPFADRVHTLATELAPRL
jgi:hypothetical protein